MIGAPGFNGDRLREAREARGLTISQLGEMIGVTKQAVSLYEKAKSGPAPDTFDRMARTLRVPKHYFLRPATDPPGGPVFYRSMASATKQMRERAERRLGWFRSICRYAAEYVDWPAVDVPDLGFPADPAKVSDEAVEEAATTVRRGWGLGDGPISNVALLMENKGILATRFDLEADKLDAFSVWDVGDGRPYMVLGADQASAVRSRFDAAHELAHLVFHRNVPGVLIHKGPSFNLIEAQAHRFARAFLLPRQAMLNEYVPPNLHALKELKLKWKVSIGLIVMRAGEMGLFTPEQTERLWKHRVRLGWKTREPHDEELEPERPVLAAKSIRLLIDSGTASAADILRGVALNAEDVEALTGVPPGTLRPVEAGEPADPEPRLLKFSRLTGAPGQAS